MVKINNNIDNNCKALIYYKDELVGECLNELAFLDVRVQIKREQDENYSCVLINTKTNETSDRFKFDKRGCVPLSAYELYWNNFDDLLTEIISI